MIREYRVRWEIDIDADSPLHAAQKALTIQRDPHSTATHFEVFEIMDGAPDDPTVLEPGIVGSFFLEPAGRYTTEGGGDRDERLRTTD